MSGDTSEATSERGGAEKPILVRHVTQLFDITISIPPIGTYKRTDILILAPMPTQDRSPAKRAPGVKELATVLGRWRRKKMEYYDKSVVELERPSKRWIYNEILKRVEEDCFIDEDPDEFADEVTTDLHIMLRHYGQALRACVWNFLLRYLLMQIFREAQLTTLETTDELVEVEDRHFFPMHCFNGTDTVIAMNLAHDPPTTYCAENRPMYLLLHFLRYILNMPILAKKLGIYYGPDVEPLPAGLDLFEDGNVEVILTYPEENFERRLSARPWRPGDYIPSGRNKWSECDTEIESDWTDSEGETEIEIDETDSECEPEIESDETESESDSSERRRYEAAVPCVEGDMTEEEESPSDEEWTSGEESTPGEESTSAEDCEREDRDTTKAGDSPSDEQRESDSDRMELD